MHEIDIVEAIEEKRLIVYDEMSDSFKEIKDCRFFKDDNDEPVIILYLTKKNKGD